MLKVQSTIVMTEKSDTSHPVPETGRSTPTFPRVVEVRFFTLSFRSSLRTDRNRPHSESRTPKLVRDTNGVKTEVHPRSLGQRKTTARTYQGSKLPGVLRPFRVLVRDRTTRLLWGRFNRRRTKRRRDVGREVIPIRTLSTLITTVVSSF